jgi:hypothetical protein
MSSDDIVDGDDENDNVANTGLVFDRVNILAMAEALLLLDGAASAPPTSSPGGGNSPAAPAAQSTIAHQVTLAPGQIRTGINFGNHFLVAPTANPDTASTAEDTAVTIAVLNNDTDSDGTLVPASVTITSAPTRGAAVVNANGTITYTPNANLFGPDSLGYTVRDNDGLVSNEAVVSINVQSVNDAPAITSNGGGDSAAVSVAENTTTVTTVLATDPDGPTAFIFSIAGGSDSSRFVIDATSGALRFAVAPDFEAPTDTNVDNVYHVIVRASDGTLSDTQAIAVTVTDVLENRAPSAVDDAYTTNEDTPRVVSAALGLLANDVDPDNDALTARLVTGPSSGSLTLNANGSFTYTPAPNFFGVVTFTYVANDGKADSNLATARITIVSVNDAPVAQNDQAVTDENVPVIVNVLANDSDIDGSLNPATVAVKTGPKYGTVSVDATTGQIRYTPGALFAGTDTFTYTVKDNQGLESGTATVTIEIRERPGQGVHWIVDPCDPDQIALKVVGTEAADVIKLVAVGKKGDVKVLINNVEFGVFRPAGRIIVYGLGGNDDIEASSGVTNTVTFFGGAGNDRLKGGGGSALLLGGTGDDELISGKDRSLLIGGTGADRVVGGSGDDILIGGTTSFDDDHFALCELLERWGGAGSYASRIQDLQLNPPYLTRVTVFDDSEVDQLTGSSGLDWWFLGLGDVTTDRKAEETVTAL